MYRRSRKRLTLEGWFYLGVMGFVLAGALLREINLLVVLFGLMAGPIVFNRWAARWAAHSVEVRRRLPKHISAGDTLTVTMEARNKRRGAVWSIAVEDALRPESGEDSISAAAYYPFIPGCETRRVTYRGVLPHRGRWKFGPLAIISRFPLGLVQQKVDLPQSSSIIVLPRLGRLLPGWQRLFRADQQGVRPVPRPTSGEGDFHGLRDWRPGDSRRMIHWRTTARHGEMMVRELERRRGQDLCLILDLHLSPQATSEERAHFEQLVSLAATIVADTCRRGHSRLVLATAGAAPQVFSGLASSSRLVGFLEQLALCGPTSAGQGAKLLSLALDEVRPGATVVALSTRPRDAAEADLANAGDRRRAKLGQINWLDLSTPATLAEYFVL